MKTISCLLSLAATLFCSFAFAAYPDKPIKINVAFPPDSSTDIIARKMGQPLSEALGQPVVVQTGAKVD